VNVDRETWFEFFGITCELNAIICVHDMDEHTRSELSKAVRKLEEWRAVNLELDTADAV
jgi:hypothetical protein